jgi:hypothetical protein
VLFTLKKCPEKADMKDLMDALSCPGKLRPAYEEL